jgi:hypothetical protein
MVYYSMEATVMARIAVIFDNEFLLQLLVDIEERIDKGSLDLQQASVAIKQLRCQLGTPKILNGTLKPGLERK